MTKVGDTHRPFVAIVHLGLHHEDTDSKRSPHRRMSVRNVSTSECPSAGFHKSTLAPQNSSDLGNEPAWRGAHLLLRAAPPVVLFYVTAFVARSANNDATFEDPKLL
jgi:hypothetical protein